MDSWWLAYVMDQNEEEKEKGKTVEVGRATMETPRIRYTIFDAPGHKNYVPNMIQGAACADFASLVISARKGEFEAGFEREGQTREHAQLAKSLGVTKLIIIVNKLDDCQWRPERYNEIKEKVDPFLAQCGYDINTDVFWIPIAGITGENIKFRKDVDWYKGPTLLELFDQMTIPNRNPNGPIRIPILDKMIDRGVIVFGKVESGTINIGEKIAVAPSLYPCQVLNIFNVKEQLVRYAKAGENVKLRLAGVDDESVIQKGNVICNRDNTVPISQIFIAEIRILQLLEHKPIFSTGYKSMMHIHTVQEECLLKEIDIEFVENEKGKTEKVKPKFVTSGALIHCKIQMNRPICLEKHDTIEQMGRFTLRDDGKTIALGKILKYKPANIDVQTDGLNEEQRKQVEEARRIQQE